MLKAGFRTAKSEFQEAPPCLFPTKSSVPKPSAWERGEKYNFALSGIPKRNFGMSGFVPAIKTRGATFFDNRIAGGHRLITN